MTAEIRLGRFPRTSRFRTARGRSAAVARPIFADRLIRAGSRRTAGRCITKTSPVLTGCRIGTFRRRAGIRIAGIAFTRPVVTRRFIGTRRYRTTIGGSAAVAAVIFTRSYRIGTIGVRTARSGSAAVAAVVFTRGYRIGTIGICTTR